MRTAMTQTGKRYGGTMIAERSGPGDAPTSRDRGQPLVRGVDMTDATCSVDKCDKPVKYVRDQLCSMHYQRRAKTGRTGGTERWMPGRPPRSEQERFWENVDRRGPDECWPWTACTEQGYGRFHRQDQTTIRAHRFAYELLRRLVPDGLVLDHVCHTRDPHCPGGETCPHRRCCNPAHLAEVDRPENFRRGRGPQLKPHCARGHPWTEENTRIRVSGGRTCRFCERETQRRRRARG